MIAYDATRMNTTASHDFQLVRGAASLLLSLIVLSLSACATSDSTAATDEAAANAAEPQPTPENPVTKRQIREIQKQRRKN